MKQLVLFDINKELCDEWNKLFKDEKNVKIINTSFKELQYEYVVTAGNSYGWMTGGIDLAVRNYYGIEIQDIIQNIIIGGFSGQLPVGESILINTYDKNKKNLIYAPTMRYPMKIKAIDIYYVFYKLLIKYDNFACCGLGTATGGLSNKECAKIMYKAYIDYINYYKN